jgi:hypothetical protein
VVLGIAWFVGLAVAVATAVVGHDVLTVRDDGDLTSIEDTLRTFARLWVPYAAGIVSGIVAVVVGWRQLVAPRSPGDRRRVAFVLGWSLVGWVAAIVAGNLLYSSANALVYLIAVGFGVAANLALLLRDRRRTLAQHRATTTQPVRSADAD